MSLAGLPSQTAQAQVPAAYNTQAYYESVMQARASGDLDRYRDGLQRMLGSAENNAALLYRLAGAYALLGDTARALPRLRRLATAGFCYAPASDTDFARVHGMPALQRVQEQLQANCQPLVTSQVGFRLADATLVPEGVAYDARRRTFYLGSMAQQKIVMRDKRGRVRDFAQSGADSLGAVLGLHVDPVRRRLWACAGSSGQRASGLWEYDLTSGRLLNRYLLPVTAAQPHLFNDVVVATDGTAYATDSEAGTVYRVQPSGSLQALLPLNTFVYPNGITLSSDQTALLVAHYGGVDRVELATRTHLPLRAAEPLALGQLDGLYLNGNALVGVQNGPTLRRIVRFYLDETQRAVTRVEVLEANRPEFAALPTTGVLIGTEFWYLANSHLGALDKQNRIRPDADSLTAPLILRLPLRANGP